VDIKESPIPLPFLPFFGGRIEIDEAFVTPAAKS
jgi:hypothetical protein